ncbi:MAG: DUF4838 domain-containing protein [Bacteroidales bacterium]|nr:DUF4838 domain-containing protein [Bacteroidales bacterium]
MKDIKLSILFLFFLFAVMGCQGQLTIVDQKQSDYTIILPAYPQPDEVKAATELQKYLAKISGVTLQIIADDQEPANHEIIIGKSHRFDQFKVKAGFKEFEGDGFLILTKKEQLFIIGGSPQGTLNGVYTFLEEYLGCRFYSPDVIFIPKLYRIALPAVKDRQVPMFTYREMYFPGRNDPEYLAWHKLHSHNSGAWGMWVHTFDDLIPPETYFSAHPEYFSEINGIRTLSGQICLTNPEVFNVLVENLRTKMEAQPGALYWSVSQNDNYLACQCNECRQAAEDLGGESALLLQFVNRVAALFPDKVISTLAYQYTRSAPGQVKPLPNVNIMLCSIECNRSLPIADDPTSASFVKDIKDWTKLTGNILIWDYVVQFRNYISPFPNLRVLQPNLAFFADKGCRLMFQQGSGSALSEFVDLRSYMIAKLLWNPELDAQEIMKDFLAGYYGAAAPYLEDYIGILHDELESPGDNLWIYGYPYSGIDSYLRPHLIPFYQDLFDKAEKAVEYYPEILDRVRFARLPLDFAILDISLHQADLELSWFLEEDGGYGPKEEMVNLLDTFVNRCNRLHVAMLNEKGTTPDDYRLMVRQYLIKNADRHLAIDKEVTLLTPFSPKYEAGGAKALTDGLKGIDDYHFNWLGFEGEDLEAIIDLGKETVIREISVDFLQDVQSWVFLPKQFTASYSTDGEQFTEIGTVENITPDNKTGAFIKTFTIPAENIKARYIKVKAESLKICPGWHIGSGKKSWIFTDEIVVK